MWTKTLTLPLTLCPKSPSVLGFVACLPVRLLFKSISHHAFYPVSSTQFKCCIATMTKLGKLYCVTRIEPTGEKVKMRRNLAHWGSWTQCITHELLQVELSYSHVYSLWQEFSMSTKIFDLVTLTLKFDLLLKNFNLGHNFLARRGRDFILHMYIPCDQTFPWVPTFLTRWPWSLTYF